MQTQKRQRFRRRVLNTRRKRLFKRGGLPFGNNNKTVYNVPYTTEAVLDRINSERNSSAIGLKSITKGFSNPGILHNVVKSHKKTSLQNPSYSELVDKFNGLRHDKTTINDIQNSNWLKNIKGEKTGTKSVTVRKPPVTERKPPVTVRKPVAKFTYGKRRKARIDRFGKLLKITTPL